MKFISKKINKMAIMVVIAMSVMAVSVSAADVIPDSYVFADGGSYLTGQMPEYVRSWLLASKISVGGSGPMYNQYVAVAQAGTQTAYYKYNNAYYRRNVLAATYITLTGTEKSIGNALGRMTAEQPLTRVAKESSFSGTKLCYYTGLIPVNANSSLSVGRPADYNAFATYENTTNSANPIGSVKYLFAAPLDKSSQSNIKIYLNGSATEPAMANAIKGLLFNKFNHTADAANELTGTINSTYSGLKNLMKNYNDGAEVTSITISGVTTDGGTEELQLSID